MSNAPAAIRGCYSDLKLIKGRKVAQIHIEIPIEQAEQFVAAFGIPNAAEETWVALARLDLVNDNGKPNDNWKPDEINVAQHCALVCQKPTFWEYLQSRSIHCEGEQDAATYVRRWCEINTRADLATNEKARGRWEWLESHYDDWMGRRAAP
jgi:hypothetical protein